MLPSTVLLAGHGAEPGCAHRVYKILNEILIAMLERTCDDIYTYIQQRKCRVEVTSEGSLTLAQLCTHQYTIRNKKCHTDRTTPTIATDSHSTTATEGVSRASAANWSVSHVDRVVQVLLAGLQLHPNVHGCQLCDQVAEDVGYRDDVDVSVLQAEAALPLGTEVGEGGGGGRRLLQDGRDDAATTLADATLRRKGKEGGKERGKKGEREGGR